MPLQIRRGPTADRESIVPLEGELVYDSTTGAVYIGNGFSPGGVPVTNISPEDVRNIAAGQFLGLSFNDNSLHNGITFQYVDSRLIATISEDLAGNFTGNLSGSVFADDSALIIDGVTGTVYGPFIGSLFDQSSNLLVNGDNGSINLDGTVKGNVIPDESEQYDLGSFTNKFKDLYLSGSSLWLGDAQITALNTAIVLPAGTTVDGNPVGIELGQEYEINIKGNVRGSVFSDDSTIPTDPEVSPQTFTVVSVANPDPGGSGAVYEIDGEDRPVLNLVRGGVYTFDQSDASNVTHQIAFKDSADNSYTVGVVTTGAVGTVGAQTVITVAADAPADLRYYCVTHGNGMGNTISVTNPNNSTGIQPLVDAINSSINLDGTVKGNIIPDLSEIHNIGSFTTKFDKLYLSESNASLWIGNAAIGSNGAVIDLPEGSTVGGVAIGSAAGDGVIPGSNYNINIVGDDSSIIVNSSNGNIKANNLGVSSTLSIGSEASPFEISNFSNLALMTTSGSTPIQMLTDIVYVGTTERNSQLRVYSIDSPNTSSILVQNYNNDSSASNNTTFIRSRGTGDTPITVQTNDTIHSIKFNGFDGASFENVSSEISSSVSGSVSTGIVPGRLVFSTTNASGVLSPALVISNNQIVSFNAGAEFTAFADVEDSRNLNFLRFRGNSTSSLAVENNDQIYGIRFLGYDGLSSQLSSVIRSEVEGTVSSGTVPGRLRFLTTDTSGTLTSAMIIRNDQTVEILKKLKLNNAGFDLDANKAGQTSNLQLFTRSRGSVISPSAVAADDHIYTLRFSAYDGTTNQISSQIRAEVLGAPVPGTAVQGRLRLLVSDGSGTQVAGVTVTANATVINTPLVAQSSVRFPVYADSAARDTAVPNPQSGMVVFVTDVAKLQVNTDGTLGGWVNLH